MEQVPERHADQAVGLAGEQQVGASSPSLADRHGCGVGSYAQAAPPQLPPLRQAKQRAPCAHLINQPSHQSEQGACKTYGAYEGVRPDKGA